jgi:DNA mismatch endonuclease (patch repair protein)
MDRLTKERRSWNMSRIRGRDTSPERAVRSILHRLGYRFRLHARLPGRPDVVLPKYRTVVFVHGCFWHRHSGCPYAYAPNSRTEFWSQKFADNVARDRGAAAELRALGWQVLVAWECELRDTRKLSRRLDRELRRAARMTVQKR